MKGLLIGAHESVAGGVSKSFTNAINDECECFQLFVKNANRWQAAPLKEKEIQTFKEYASEFGNKKICAHSAYLINLCSPKEDTYKKSIKCFIDEMSRCTQLGIPYYVMHPGSHLGEGEDFGLKKLTETIDTIFSENSFDTMLLLEVTAGQGTNLGYKWEHIDYVISNSNFPEKIGVCLDSAHMYAAGYDLVNEYDVVIETFFQKFGNKIKVFHLNDTNKECGSRIDRHEDIGKGLLGIDFFKKVVNDKRLEGVLGILETPLKSDNSYLNQIKLLKSLREEQ